MWVIDVVLPMGDNWIPFKSAKKSGCLCPRLNSKSLFHNVISFFKIYYFSMITESAGAVEYTDCTSAEG